jgi:hypothetical protein
MRLELDFALVPLSVGSLDVLSYVYTYVCICNRHGGIMHVTSDWLVSSIPSHLERGSKSSMISGEPCRMLERLNHAFSLC